MFKQSILNICFIVHAFGIAVDLRVGKIQLMAGNHPPQGAFVDDTEALQHLILADPFDCDSFPRHIIDFKSLQVTVRYPLPGEKIPVGAK